MNVTIAFCVIVEGDSKLDRLKGLISSLKRHDSMAYCVNSIHITANGGEDGESTDMVEQFCQENNFDYSYLKWDDDFSAQRNFNFARVPKDTDYILWADSDDVIVGAQHLQTIALNAMKQGLTGLFFDYWYGCSFNGEPSLETLHKVEVTQTRERLLQAKKYIWKGRLHETPVPKDNIEQKYSMVKYSKEFPVAWLHLSADRFTDEATLHKRMTRNRRILEKQLQDERKSGTADPRTLLYLMKILAESTTPQDWEDCIDMGQEYLEKSGWDKERAICLGLMAKCYGMKGNDKLAEIHLHDAIREFPQDPVLYLKLAQAYMNQGKHKEMKHWMDIGMNMEVKTTDNITNLLELDLLSAQLTTQYLFNVERDVERAYKASEKIYELDPNEHNKRQMDELYDLAELNKASRNTHRLVEYLDSIGETEGIIKLIDSLPSSLRNLPFANKLYNKYAMPRVWGENEICYYATFGNAHFEKWSPHSLESGIGGSETAVIQLAKQWTELGYKVTVYGDPGVHEGVHDGVTYLPWYKFNHKDTFNIFIQWRNASMTNKIVAKKVYVDLHDVFSELDIIPYLPAIDKVMVKSQYHRELAPNIPDDKFAIISNGI